MQNQKIPIAVIVTMLIQTVAAIWWLAKLDLRVHMHDKFIEQNNGLTVTVYRLEERVKNLSEELDEFKLQVLSGKIKSYHLYLNFHLTMTRYILSVDGGGIRGIIPAIILAEIEKRTRKPISQIFDLMAGTSTGGIVVAGLCKKDEQGNPQYSANDLVELYQEYGAYIFKSSFFRQSILSWFNCAQYPYENIESVLEKYFGEDILKNTLSKVLITSYDIHNNYPFFFKSWKEDRNFIRLKDALRATTAAPTYFAPKYLEVKQEKRVLVDGGVFANNPAACAYGNSKKLFPNEEIVLVSIGTGRLSYRIKYRKLGKIAWIKPLLNVMFASSLDVVNYQLGNVMDDRYIRIQSQLTIASAEMDNVTPKNIKCLQQEANAMIEGNKKVIDKFCDIVS